MVARSGAIDTGGRRTCGRNVEDVNQNVRRCCKGSKKQAVPNKGGRSGSESSTSGRCEDKVLSQHRHSCVKCVKKLSDVKVQD